MQTSNRGVLLLFVYAVQCQFELGELVRGPFGDHSDEYTTFPVIVTHRVSIHPLVHYLMLLIKGRMADKRVFTGIQELIKIM